MNGQWDGGPTVLSIADAKRCADACAEIYAARPKWIRRVLNGQAPFYTLGRAAYLDLGFSAGPLETYLADPKTVRTATGRAVAAILDDVCDALSDALGAPVQYPPALPSPGFHIYIGRSIAQEDCAVRRQDCASCHFDLQHEYVPWSRWFSEVDMQQTISFTLPVNLPAAGGGLTMWKSLTLDKIGPISDFDFRGTAHTTPSETLHYTIGHLVLHDGHVLHHGAGVSPVSVTDERITLQGDGVWADGAWQLYW